MLKKQTPVRFLTDRVTIGLAASYILLAFGWLMLGNASEKVTFVINSVLIILPETIAFILGLQLIRRPADQRLRILWGLVVTGIGCWTLSDLIKILESFTGNRLNGSIQISSGVNLAGYLVLLAGFLFYAFLLKQFSRRLRLLLDITISAGAITALSWVVFILPLFGASSVSIRDVFWPTSFPAFDMALLVVAINILLIADHEAIRRFTGYFILTMASYIFGDLAFATMSIQGQYQAGGIFDLAWVIGNCLLVLGSLYYYRHADQQAIRLPLSLRDDQKWSRQLQATLPLAASLALVVYTLVMWQMEGYLPQGMLWLTALIWLLLIARQGVAAGEFELEQYATLVNHAAEPAFICNSDGKFTLVNPALLRATGYDQENELLGQPLGVLINVDKIPGGFRNPHSLSENWSGEVALSRKDRSNFPADLSLQPIKSRGLRRTSLAGTAHDLTEQKKQQEELRNAYKKIIATHAELENLNQRLEEIVREKTSDLTETYHQLETQNKTLQVLDQLKSDFVSMVSHELRGPLTNISGGIELVLDREETLPADTRESLVIVRSEIQRLVRFVETILDLSALDAGRMPLYPVPQPAEDVIWNVVKQYGQSRDVSRIRVNLPGRLPFVLADENGLTSVLFHLIDNAIKYAPQGMIEISAEEKDEKVYFHVIDHGPGIPSGEIPMIYEKFYRLNSKDSQTVYGHGLGLYIVRRLLESMHGDIQVENHPEGGADFCFWLPRAEENDELQNTTGR